jgi:hypothetical protein
MNKFPLSHWFKQHIGIQNFIDSWQAQATLNIMATWAT